MIIYVPDDKSHDARSTPWQSRPLSFDRHTMLKSRTLLGAPGLTTRSDRTLFTEQASYSPAARNQNLPDQVALRERGNGGAQRENGRLVNGERTKATSSWQ